MGKFNLTEAAKEILQSNVGSKQGGQDKPARLQASVAYGTKEAGMVGQSPEKSSEELPDYLKGVPSATPPGATPPVGAAKDGVGASKPAGQPQETQGRGELRMTKKQDATDYESIRDRKKATMPASTMQANPGATAPYVPEETEEEGEVFAEAKEDKEDKESAAHERKERMKMKMKEDIDALLEGENLSEEFVSKATTIFEAAVIARAEEVIAEAEEELVEQFQEAVEQIKEELAGKVDDYLNYMVEEWIQENQIAINKGLRAEIVEDFITGLHNLFAEHYIDIPEDKVDVVEELTTKVEELEASLNEQISSAVQLKKELNEHKKIEAIYTACEGLTQTQVEKMKSLAESVEFTTEEEFAGKLATIKESYFKTPVKAADSSALNEEVQIEEEKKPSGLVDPMIEQYAKTISKTLVK